jgi:hypothetical protein
MVLPDKNRRSDGIPVHSRREAAPHQGTRQHSGQNIGEISYTPWAQYGIGKVTAGTASWHD